MWKSETTYGSQFSRSTKWVLGDWTQVRRLDSNCFAHRSICQGHYFFFNPLCLVSASCMHKSMGLSLGHKDPANGYTPKEKWLPFPEATNWHLPPQRWQCSFSSLHAGIFLTGLTLCSSCIGNENSCELMYPTTAYQGPLTAPPPHLVHLSAPSSMALLGPEEEGWYRGSSYS